MTVALAVGRLVDQLHHHQPEEFIRSSSLLSPQQRKMIVHNSSSSLLDDPNSVVTANLLVQVLDDALALREDADSPSDFNASLGSVCDSKREEIVVEGQPVLDNATGRSEAESVPLSSPDLHVRRCRRSVRFLTDDSDRVVEQVYRYNAVSDRRKDRCYMSKDELGEAVEKANQFAKSYAHLHEDWHGTVESLLLQCPSEEDDFVNDVGDEDTQEAILILTESSARGLEFSSKLLQKHQEWANRSIVRRYHQLVAKMAAPEGDDDGDPTASQSSSLSRDVHELLRERCEHVNRFTRRLAFQMARGDAIQAQIVYEEDGTWAKWKKY